jgi:uncharacterized protein
MQFKAAGKFILKKLQKELPDHLTYHSIYHAMDVYDAAKRIAKEKGISAYEQKLLLTAALFHDSGFIKARLGHEQESCHIARRYLPSFGYQPAEIELICGMIMSTRIPQSPQTYLEEVLCDADLDYLGRDDFFTTGQKLFDELKCEGLIHTEKEWNQYQSDFLVAHHYHTTISDEWRNARKEEYIKLVQAKI